MSRATFALSVLAMSLLWTLGVQRTARAEGANPKAMPVYVLSILTDDVDDQADALTLALRARVKQAPGWSLLETPQSLETLTIALKCPPKPDTPCLQKIGDQLHADHFVWGTLKKKGSEVAAEVHLWSRGRPQTDGSESYSESLKEANDAALKAVAARLFAQVTGGSAGGAGGGAAAGAEAGGGGPAEAGGGVLVVHAGTGGGTVLVDGVEKGTLDGGDARVNVSEGSHKVTVHVPGFQAPSLSTNIKSGAEQEVSFALSPAKEGEGVEAEAGSSKPFPVRKVIAYSALGVGVALLAVGGIEMAAWFSDKNTNESNRANIPSTITDACSVTDGGLPYYAAAKNACNASEDAKSHSALAWGLGLGGLAVAGTGVVLLLTDHGSTDASSGSLPAAHVGRFAVTPMLGPQGGGMRLKLNF
jgi:hypothetical protein